MGANPIPLCWQGQLQADQIQRFILPGTMGLFIQAIVISVDNGDIQITDINFVKKRGFRQFDGTVNIVEAGYMTVQNMLPFDFYRGIILNEDIGMTMFDNSGVNTDFSIILIPARRDAFPFVGKATRVPLTPVAIPPPERGPLPA